MKDRKTGDPFVRVKSNILESDHKKGGQEINKEAIF